MNELLDRAAVERLVAGLLRASPGTRFDALDAAADHLDDLSLRARSDLLARAMLSDLDPEYAALAATVRTALLEPTFSGWIIWPVTEAVTTSALAAGELADGLALLAELTPRLSSEFAIRRLLQADLEGSLRVIERWTTHTDEHVRRLATEGTRHYLPWAVRVQPLLLRPEATIPILDALYRDESDYVRRSVANHLNDLSRDNAELVVATAARWLADGDAATRGLVRHALRTLVKRGDPAALALLGFGPVSVAVTELSASPHVQSPGYLEFEATLSNHGTERAVFVIDFVVSFLKANGSHADKVFKLNTGTLEPGASLRVAKRHPIRPITTRVYYPGEHFVALQVNGERSERVGFELLL